MTGDKIKALAASAASFLVTAGLLDVGQADAVNSLVGAALVVYAAFRLSPKKQA